jgi:hypothetical protein
MKEKSAKLYFMFWESGESFSSFLKKTLVEGDGRDRFPLSKKCTSQGTIQPEGHFGPHGAVFYFNHPIKNGFRHARLA